VPRLFADVVGVVFTHAPLGFLHLPELEVGQGDHLGIGAGLGRKSRPVGDGL